MLTLADHLRAEPFELILSSGFFGFFAHAGMVRALEEAGVVPALVGGSSAGALIAGLWGAGIPALAIRERLFALRRADFWDPDLWLGLRAAWSRRNGAAARAWPGPGLLAGERYQRLLEEMLATAGVSCFSDCRLPVRLVAYEPARRRVVVLSDGPLARAIRASSSVPGLFQPTLVGTRRYVDGGISDRAGISAATAGARVLYHHLPPNAPWNRLTPSQIVPPAWPRLHVLSEPRLPLLSPFHLHRGPRAYEMARASAARLLDGPLSSIGAIGS